jgi:hypothetical protein
MKDETAGFPAVSRVQHMNVGRVWLTLSLAAALLMAVASAAGIYWPEVYARETMSWAAQGIGQDIVNLFVIAPALALCSYFVARGSIRAWFVWMGLLLYVIYSYVLYAFFVHFNRLFLVYVSVLGLASWAVAGGLSGINLESIARACDRTRRYLPQAAYLAASGLLFALLWLSDIVPATLAGVAPRGLAEVGLAVNPVHVLDLAFVLPAMIVTSALLWKGHRLGMVFTVPLLVFAAAMGTAIAAMSAMMIARGLGEGGGIIALFVVLVVVAMDLAYLFLRRAA